MGQILSRALCKAVRGSPTIDEQEISGSELFICVCVCACGLHGSGCSPASISLLCQWLGELKLTYSILALDSTPRAISPNSGLWGSSILLLQFGA